ncbi:hypothetical protein GGTG_06727 [Gaeumannomyces tritici R3-111a-1]|uniref:Uncharacterized protein n=1 Tax=Gaeumannomyces tritici (strain R3-111a-1) TaxID=644352 RepID=J3NZN0_GAET3|nr:hypothetical protein GGTG_06727 [Gaeumannomyces tritici R3-111a-1]EJT76813.1 hypothetical protein GGTG_06727 [Gaeumannomyces tritici R3-111a-1]
MPRRDSPVVQGKDKTRTEENPGLVGTGMEREIKPARKREKKKNGRKTRPDDGVHEKILHIFPTGEGSRRHNGSPNEP